MCKTVAILSRVFFLGCLFLSVSLSVCEWLGCQDCLQNGLYCVWWGVKLSTQFSCTTCVLSQEIRACDAIAP